MTEGVELIAGKDKTPPHEIRLLRQGTEIELAGGMPFGTTDALSQVLSASPSIRVIHLNSYGGRLVEGERVARLIGQHRLATYTATDCISACTIAFLAGETRYLGNKARLGFHSASLAGLDHQKLPAINEQMRATLKARGVPAWFIRKAFSTNATEVWYPTHDELLSAKVIDRVVDSGDFGMSGVANWRDRESIEVEILKAPLFAALKQFDPNNYSEIAKHFVGGVVEGKPANELVASSNLLFMTVVLPRYLTTGTDASLLRYWRSQIATMNHLNKTNPALCLEFLYPERRQANFNPAKIVPKPLLDEDIASLTQLIRDTAASPRPIEAAEKVDGDLNYIVQRIQSTAPGVVDVVAKPETFMDQPQRVCGAIVLFYSEVLTLPPEKSAAVLRFLMAEETTSASAKR